MIFTLFVVFVSFAAQAAGSGQTAFVQVESSMVYETPSFDAPVISDLKSGAKIRISTKLYGANSGQFYMVKLPSGKLGYVADIDVITESKRTKITQQAHKEKARAQKLQKDWDKDTDAVNHEDKSIFERNYVGAFGGIWNYRQKLGGETQQSPLAFYGIKITTAHLLRRGPMLEANWGFHFGAPAFFKRFSTGKTSGFLTDLDLLLINPILKGEHWLGYIGLGPLLHFRSITANSVTSNNFRVGASFSLGGAYQFGRFCTRLEGKYMWEHTGQTAFLASLQTAF